MRTILFFFILSLSLFNEAIASCNKTQRTFGYHNCTCHSGAATWNVCCPGGSACSTCCK